MTDLTNAIPANQKSTLAEFVDSLSKATVVVLFAIYVFGFLIVSIHDASYGLSEVNPLKPKIVAAGTLFLLFVSLPVLSARPLFSHREELTSQERFSWAFLHALMYFAGCVALSSFLNPLYMVVPAGPTVSHHWWSAPWFSMVSVLVFLVSVGLVIEHGKKSYRTRPMRTALITAVSVLGYLVLFGYWSRTYVSSRVALWFFGIGVFGVLVDNRTNHPEKRKTYDWSGLAGPIVLALVIFPTVIYPNIKSAWGGGSPTPIVVYFSPDSRILPGQQMKAELLDESDFGIYVVRSGDKQALFIPRASVSAMSFSNEMLPDEFFQVVPKRP